jgi:CheY-like chemotaxis protein
MTAQKTPVPFILIAEDSPDDRVLMQYAFRSAKLPNKYHIVNNGAEAITWLTQAAEQPDNPICPQPDLVVLDIQMPFKNGLEVLQWLREQPRFQDLPVVILSGMNSPQMVQRALSLGAHSYLFKPGDYSELTRFIYGFNMMQSVHAG